MLQMLSLKALLFDNFGCLLFTAFECIQLILLESKTVITNNIVNSTAARKKICFYMCKNKGPDHR